MRALFGTKHMVSADAVGEKPEDEESSQGDLPSEGETPPQGLSISASTGKPIPLLFHEAGGTLTVVDPIATVTFFSGDGQAAAEAIRAQLRAVVAANPWLGSRLHVLPKQGWPGWRTEMRIPEDLGVDDVFLDAGDCGIRPSMAYEEIWRAWSGTRLRAAVRAWATKTQLFRVAVTSTGPNGFALVVELNHVLGDGDTFYKVYGMLQPGAAIVALSPERKDGFSAFLADSQGASDHLYTPSLRRCVKPVIGMVQTFCKRAVQPPRVFSVDSQWLAQQKADAPACSTNDILTSALLKGCGARYGIVPVNLRGRIPGIDCSDAGNYWRPQEILDDEFQTPLGVRGVISTATAAAPTCAEQKRGSRRPRLAQAGRIGFVTNWTAFYRDLDLPGCEQLLHMPLMRSKQMSRSYFVIFRPAKGQVAVWCAARDAGVAKGLEKLPVFSASVGMLA